MNNATVWHEELYEAYPTNVEFKNGLAIACQDLGKTATAHGQPGTGLRLV